MSNEITKQENPFSNSAAQGNMVQAQARNAVANSDQQRAVAEVQAAMMIARMNPRNPIVAMDRILNACTRPSLADAALYSYARGGTDITGPSIRLAEAMAQSWGNMQFGIRELDQRNGESTVQAFAWDVETNTRREVTFQVPHTRYTKNGSKRLEDPRDIYEMVANQGARRLRACILAVIPGDVTEAAVNQCETTMKSKVAITPEFIQSLIESFAKYNVTKEQIEKRIQRRIDSIQPAQVVALKKIQTSMRDGISTAADWFEVADGAQAQTAGVEGVKEKLRNKTQAAAVPRQESVDQSTGEILSHAGNPATGAPAVTFATVAEKLNKAKDLDLLDVHADLIAQVEDDAQQAELTEIYRVRREALTA